jgi:arginyl-tRNA synthetase
MGFADGKMSSRKGNIVSAEDLISDIEAVVKEKNPESDSEKIAIAAIKYSILRQAVGGDIIYDKEKSVSFEGDSGPYLQYSCVRAKSVMAKASSAEIKNRTVGTLDRTILRFPEIVLRAQTEYAPHHLVTYLTQLAGEFNNFYAHNKILEVSDDTGYRLVLTKAFIETMQNGLKILAIQVPSKM